MSGEKTQEQSSVSSEFIERRRAALERFLNRVAAHPIFCVDPDFREFLEAGNFFENKNFTMNGNKSHSYYHTYFRNGIT